MKQVIGIDGCRGGWCVVVFDNHHWSSEVFPSFDQVMRELPGAGCYLVDIPIGLGDQFIQRTVEQQVRQLLRPHRQSSVFTPPIREVLSADNYEDAKQVSASVTGKKISLQSWNITPKIREVDDYLREHPDDQSRIMEAHPELGFAGLNGGSALEYGKKTPAGFKQRMTLLTREGPLDGETFTHLLDIYDRRVMSRDDLMDALCLCLCGVLGSDGGLTAIRDPAGHDAEGIPMQMVYFNHQSHQPPV